MAWWTTQNGAQTVFDPAVGSGMLGLAVMKRLESLGRDSFRFTGVDVDAEAIRLARSTFSNLSHHGEIIIEQRDFLRDALRVVEGKPVRWFGGPFDSVICNPPFTRHHAIAKTFKRRLGDFAQRLIGVRPSGLSGLHVYFLIGVKLFVKLGGKVAFIFPQEFFTSTHGKRIWNPVRETYSVDAQIMVESDQDVFPGLKSTAAILLMTNAPQKAPTIRLTVSGLNELHDAGRAIAEMTGLPGGKESPKFPTKDLAASRQRSRGLIPFSEIGFVKRGIATGSKSFFSFSINKAQKLGISTRYLRPALTAARQLRFFDFTEEDFARLSAAGDFVWLFNRRGTGGKNEAIRRYLAYGEALGISQRAVCAVREPWHKLETRESPALFSPYLWRDSPHFVVNRSSAVGLNVVHHIYLRDKWIAGDLSVRALAAVLNSSFVRRQLIDHSRTYSGGLRKSEPNDLNSIFVPSALARGAMVRNLASRFDRLCFENRLQSNGESLRSIDRAVGRLL
jgi:hypothetical protein